MNAGDIQKLLGGYATGTLTPAERDALLAAALEDQRLFEALLAEEPLREALEDPAARAGLLAALAALDDARPQPWYYRDVHAGIIAAAVAAVLIVTLAVKFRPVPTAPPVTVVAQGELPQPAKSALPSQLTSPFGGANAPQPVSKLPEAPALAAGPSTADLQPAIDAVLAQSVASPSGGGGGNLPRPLARNALPGAASAGAALFRPLAVSVPLELRYTVLKRVPGGEFTPSDLRQELQANDEAVIRFQPNASGFLYVVERSAGGLRPIASLQVQASDSYTVPQEGALRAEGGGPREFLVLFSRQAQNPMERAAALPSVTAAQPMLPGPAAYVVTTSAQRSEQLSLTITLKYPAR